MVQAEHLPIYKGELRSLPPPGASRGEVRARAYGTGLARSFERARGECCGSSRGKTVTACLHQNSDPCSGVGRHGNALD